MTTARMSNQIRHSMLIPDFAGSIEQRLTEVNTVKEAMKDGILPHTTLQSREAQYADFLN